VTAFRAWLVLILVTLVLYTAFVTAEYGMNLFPYFFGDIAELGWPGQFNLDFTFMLSLSALWVAWRHEFSGAGIALGVLAFFGGALFLSIYLLLATRAAGGDARVLLVGPSRAA
jgi:hypothetical protein